jgi:uncharacterized paraquat-inducible protein A
MMDGWIYGYGVDINGKITYKSIDCPYCDCAIKFKTFEERDTAKRIYNFCPCCGEKIDGGNEDG